MSENHEQLRKEVSEAYKNFKKASHPIKLIPEKFSEFLKINKTLTLMLKLVILGDSIIFLLLALFVFKFY
jgi:hypothetical protein